MAQRARQNAVIGFGAAADLAWFCRCSRTLRGSMCFLARAPTLEGFPARQERPQSLIFHLPRFIPPHSSLDTSHSMHLPLLCPSFSSPWQYLTLKPVVSSSPHRAMLPCQKMMTDPVGQHGIVRSWLRDLSVLSSLQPCFSLIP